MSCSVHASEQKEEEHHAIVSCEYEQNGIFGSRMAFTVRGTTHSQVQGREGGLLVMSSCHVLQGRGLPGPGVRKPPHQEKFHDGASILDAPWASTKDDRNFCRAGPLLCQYSHIVSTWILMRVGLSTAAWLARWRTSRSPTR